MKTNINISLDKDLLEYLKVQKQIRNRSVSNLIETMLLDYLKQKGVTIVKCE